MKLVTAQLDSEDGHELRSQTLRTLNDRYIDSNRERPRNGSSDGQVGIPSEYVTYQGDGTIRERQWAGHEGGGSQGGSSEMSPIETQTEFQGIVSDVWNWNTIPLPLPQKIHYVFFRSGRLATSFLILGGVILIALLLCQPKSSSKEPKTYNPSSSAPEPARMSTCNEHLLATILSEVVETKQCCYDLSKKIDMK